ncbi:probable inactive DNA (cytosine-5)-methyltransferase DRM3 [Mercurialis annua]|uniref:probable inactive DNA (cytosine-5)-methyltransferase DRM3 n=1 Tax=Mercurialis annua TaxID=3986 RepID=UPI00215E5211|nr:probable inactive DNA (cytosine-5)-methyltransferase DRM3 [Mercurialis annua]
MGKYDNGGSSSNHVEFSLETIIPKPEGFDFNLPSDDIIYPTQLRENAAASSSAINVRSYLTEMGFLPSLVDKVIEENGDENVDLLLEVLIECSARQNSRSSDSLDTLFNNKDSSKPPEYSTFVQTKEEPDVFEFDDGKRVSLLQMNFSAEEVDFALATLGVDAPVDEIVDFITAAQAAANFDVETDEVLEHGAEKNEDISNEILYGTMQTTLKLLEMGFSESEISLAIERFGSEVPVVELANSICAEQVGEKYVIKVKSSSKHFRMNSSHDTREIGNDQSRHSYGSENREEIHRGKRPKQEYSGGYSNTEKGHFGFEENYGEEPKPVYTADLSFSVEPPWMEEKPDTETDRFGIPREPTFKPRKSLSHMVAKPPYFLYGSVATISLNTWGKISQFLYGVEPEFVDTRFFSALSRKEGYVHNLPIENRFHILPRPPMSIEHAMPQTKKWWPPWDTRKQLSYINFETNAVSQLCDRLGTMLTESRGLISDQQKRDILQYCHKLNLIWVGLHKMRPIEPEHLELILGYPLNHTETGEGSLKKRLHTLRYSFQIDTLAYHLSVLKSMFAEGITVLSLFSGIGGAEIALHRLGIHMKGVVSVETSETKRKMLRTWWRNSGQTGELEQFEDIKKLTTSRIDRLAEKFGGFDLIICESPCTSSSDNPEIEQVGDAPSGFDMIKYCEFVRVLQLVRNLV